MRPEWVGRPITVSATGSLPTAPDVTVTSGLVIARQADMSAGVQIDHTQAVVGFPLRLDGFYSQPSYVRVTYSWIRVDPANPSRETVIPE